MERNTGKNLVWLVCMLHTNELPLRYLIISLNGPTLSNNKFSGVIGKLLDSATELQINPKFEAIYVGPPLPDLITEVLKDLSTDQAYGWRIVMAIRSGVVSQDLALLEIGPVNHSMWLTIANRLLRMWV